MNLATKRKNCISPNPGGAGNKSIGHEDRKRQILDFSGMNCAIKEGRVFTPTDADCVVELRNCGWFWLEVKYAGKGVQTWNGQKRLLEAFMDDMILLGKPTMCVIADHFVDDTTRDVIVRRDCRVRELMWSEAGKRWFNYAHTKTVGDVFDRYMQFMRAHLSEIQDRVRARKRGLYAGGMDGKV